MSVQGVFFRLGQSLPFRRYFCRYSHVYVGPRRGHGLLFFCTVLLAFLCLFGGVFYLFRQVFRFLGVGTKATFAIYFRFFAVSLRVVFGRFREVLCSVYYQAMVRSGRGLFYVERVLSGSGRRFQVDSAGSMSYLIVVPRCRRVVLQLNRRASRVVLGSVGVLGFVGRGMSRFLLPLYGCV